MNTIEIREGQYKKLIYERDAIGNKYYIRRKIKWIYDNDRTREVWERDYSYATQGEAERAYNQIPDIPVERDYSEWCVMFEV